MIKLLKYGNTNTFYIENGDKGILIDTDWAGTLTKFYKEIKRNDVVFSNIKYVIATHYHPDHMGLISELMELGIKLVIFDVQHDYIHYSDEIFSRDKSLNYSPIIDSKADTISCADSRYFLSLLNINGEIIYTPGHSDDSISLILDEGIAIVGDLDPIDFIDSYDDNQKLNESWKRILYFQPKVIYYGHANERYIN